MNYYNEIDPYAAQWLRNLIEAELIPNGIVDERSIVEVTPDDLKGFMQCHFFAGIGGWSYALNLAGIPDDYPLWTGSCPCQPFSNAGKRGGTADERHLWPEMYRLIRERKPPIIFGEQVASAIGHGWLDGVSDDLEAQNYAVGAVVLPACSVGAPHIRQRLFWVADNTGDGRREGRSQPPRGDQGSDADIRSGSLHGGSIGRLEYAGHQSAGRGARSEETESGRALGNAPGHDTWFDYDLVYCADGKYRRIESGSQPLVAGVPFRLADGRTNEAVSRQEVLKGIGNAIVPQVAAEFIKVCLRGEDTK